MVTSNRSYSSILFIATAATLIFLGLLFMYSASSIFALEMHANHSYYVRRQLLGIGIGILIAISIQFISLAVIKKCCPSFYFISLALTGITLIPTLTQRIHGSSRWIKLGFLSFQPSELLKVAFILYLTYLIDTNYLYRRSFWQGFAPIMSILVIPTIILLKQPDFGLVITLITTTLIVLFIADFNNKHLLYSIATMIPVSLVLVFFKAYRIQRIITFLNPWKDPHGTGFQIIQSLIAIGSGGMSGIGMGQSKQKFFYLPMQHTDFIFAIIAEETGFIGCSAMILLFMLFMYFGIRIALKLQDQWLSLTMLGFIVLLTLQTIINLAVTTGLAPTKGIGLPFISYGNTALISTFIMLGIMISISYKTKTLTS